MFRLHVVAGAAAKRPTMRDVSKMLLEAQRIGGQEPARARALVQEATDLAATLCSQPGSRAVIDLRDPDYRRSIAKRTSYQLALNATKVVKFDGGKVGAVKRLAEIVGREQAPAVLDYIQDRLSVIRSHVAAAFSELLLREAEARGIDAEKVQLIRASSIAEIVTAEEDSSDQATAQIEMGDSEFGASNSSVLGLVEYPDAPSEGFEASDFPAGSPAIARDVCEDGATDLALGGGGSSDDDDADQASGLI